VNHDDESPNRPNTITNHSATLSSMLSSFILVTTHSMPRYLDPTEQPNPRSRILVLCLSLIRHSPNKKKNKKAFFREKRNQQIETFWLLFRHVSRIGKSWKTVLYNIFGRLSTSGEGIASFNRRG
jgi:hypothetical protein